MLFMKYIISAIILITIVIVGAFTFKRAEITNKVVAQAESRFDIKISNTVSLYPTLLFRPGITIKDLDLEKKGFLNFKASSVNISFAWSDLINRKFDINEITFDNAVVEYKKQNSKEASPTDSDKDKKLIIKNISGSISSFKYDKLNISNSKVNIKNFILNQNTNGYVAGKGSSLTIGRLNYDKISISNINIKLNEATTNLTDFNWQSQNPLLSMDSKVALNNERINLTSNVTKIDANAFLHMLSPDNDKFKFGEISGNLELSFLNGKVANGNINFTGQNAVMTGINIDRVIENYIDSNRIGLTDAVGFYFLGPLGYFVNTAKDLGSTYKGATSGKSGIKEFVFSASVKEDVFTFKDTAFQLDKYMVAMKGGINISSLELLDFELAPITKNGCSFFVQQLSGPLTAPKTKTTRMLIDSVTKPLLNLASTVKGVFFKKGCNKFYSGLMAEPIKK